MSVKGLGTGLWKLSGDGKLYFSAAWELDINYFHTSHKALGWVIGSWGGKKGGSTWETIMYLGKRCLPRVPFPHGVNHVKETFTHTKDKVSQTHASAAQLTPAYLAHADINTHSSPCTVRYIRSAFTPPSFIAMHSYQPEWSGVTVDTCSERLVKTFTCGSRRASCPPLSQVRLKLTVLTTWQVRRAREPGDTVTFPSTVMAGGGSAGWGHNIVGSCQELYITEKAKQEFRASGYFLPDTYVCRDMYFPHVVFF